MKRRLTEAEETSLVTGEAITLTAVMAICAVALVAIICYRLFISNKGETTIPGGFRFIWS